MDSETIKSDGPKWISFKSDYRLVWLSCLGLAGFIFGNILFFPVSFKKNTTGKKSIFHEIQYQPRDIVKQMVDAQVLSIENQISVRLDSLNIIAAAQAEDNDIIKQKALLVRQNKEDSSRIKKYNEYNKFWNGVGLKDTVAFFALNKALHFNIDQDLVDSIDSKNRDSAYTKIPVNASFIDLSIPVKIDTSVNLILSSYNSNIKFLSRYPAFGVWLLLIFIFSSFCFIAVSSCLYLTNKRVLLFKDNRVNGHSVKDYYLATGILLIILILLGLLWSYTFYDNEVIKDLYFMVTLNSKLRWIIFIGLVAGAFCLAGFIHSGVLLGYFAREVKKNKKKIDRNNELLSKDATAFTEDELRTMKEVETEQNRDKAIHEGLGKTFHAYFILSAIILSLLALSTGALYSAVNSLDFIKLLTDDWGYSPVRSEFVYLYGALYTIILLLIYVPARIRLEESTVVETTAKNINEQKGWWSFIKSPFDQLKGVLIAVSPLLASLVQALLDLMFN